MGRNTYGQISGSNFYTGFAVQQNAALAVQASGSAHAAKVALQAVAADGAFASLTTATKAAVTGTVSGSLASY